MSSSPHRQFGFLRLDSPQACSPAVEDKVSRWTSLLSSQRFEIEEIEEKIALDGADSMLPKKSPVDCSKTVFLQNVHGISVLSSSVDVEFATEHIWLS